MNSDESPPKEVLLSLSRNEVAWSDTLNLGVWNERERRWITRPDTPYVDDLAAAQGAVAFVGLSEPVQAWQPGRRRTHTFAGDASRERGRRELRW